MSNDKYQRLRDALAAGPLPGDWVADFASAMRNGSPAVVEYFVRRDGDDISIAADIVDPISGTPSSVNADYIAAADPDTIRAMLDRLDAAERECERLRDDAERYRWLRGDSCPNHSSRWTQWEVRCWKAPSWTGDLRRADLDDAIDAARGKE